MKPNRFRIGLAAGTVLLAAAMGLTGLSSPANDEHGYVGLPRRSQTSEMAQIDRGRYLATAGNCAGCHTAPGGAAYAGGLGISTPFGDIYTSNLTPDRSTGIGQWSNDDFWKALHEGRSADGRLLFPAFPYTSFTNVSREDSDALFAYLRTLPRVIARNREHALRFPFDTQTALRVWRALYFTPGSFKRDSGKSDDWNRGAYLVQGLGHCVACHGPRNAMGATRARSGLSGGVIAGQRWYAPALNAADEASMADWEVHDIVELLRTGVGKNTVVSGPMADVVYQSTQLLSVTDLTAIAVYLKEIPKIAEGPPVKFATLDEASHTRGGELYDKHCAACHGDQGQGAAGAYPALAGNRAVTMPRTVNLVQIVRHGGFAASTAANPRPYGMPPFEQTLSDVDIAAVLTYIRNAWGNAAAPVSALDVLQR